MYLHLGNNVVIESKEIIGVFDVDKTTVFKVNRNYLLNIEKRGKIITVTKDLPKSFTVCIKQGDDSEKVYLSTLLSSTLLKRSSTFTLD